MYRCRKMMGNGRLLRLGTPMSSTYEPPILTRRFCKAEVRGSNPLGSTHKIGRFCKSPGPMSHFGSGSYVPLSDPASVAGRQWLQYLYLTDSTHLVPPALAALTALSSRGNLEATELAGTTPPPGTNEEVGIRLQSRRVTHIYRTRKLNIIPPSLCSAM